MNRDLAYFPPNYHSSRERFAARVGVTSGVAKKGSWKVPGRRDNDLYVDYAWLPATGSPDLLLVLTSGIHGAEAYLGAAVQMMFIDEILPLINRGHVGIFMAHAMNPYGFKHHQRCTEANVNLNRNFSLDGEMFKLKYPDAARVNEKYLVREPVASLRSRLIESLRMKDGVPYLDEISLDKFMKIIAPGQFESPEHVEYGGKDVEPQTRALIEMMRELIPQYRDILGLDLHTGLGDRGRLHLLSGGPKEQMNPELTNELFDAKSDREFYVFTPPDASGFYEVHGAINGMFSGLAKKPGQRVCALTMEFGTLGHSAEAQLDGLNRFVLEHQGQLFGYANPEIETRVRALNFERSHLADEGWRIGTLAAARGMFKAIFSRVPGN